MWFMVNIEVYKKEIKRAMYVKTELLQVYDLWCI